MTHVKVIQDNISVRAVMEITADTTQVPSLSMGQRLVQAIIDNAQKFEYAKTPDGWFVPLQFLLDRIGGVSDLLHFEALQYGECEIYGGLEIFAANQRVVEVASGATFGTARDVVNAILQGEPPSRERYIFLNPQRRLHLLWEQQAVRIQSVEFAAHRKFEPTLVSTLALQQSMKRSWKEVVSFAHELEPTLLQDVALKLTRENFRRQFGLDDLD